MDRVTIRMPRVQVVALYLLVEEGRYPNRSEALRALATSATHIGDDMLKRARNIDREVTSYLQDERDYQRAAAQDARLTKELFEAGLERASERDQTLGWRR